MFILPPALAPMAAYRQFIIYFLTPSKTRPGKTDKFPCDPATGRVTDAHDRSIWTDWQSAAQAAATHGPAYGVGFVFCAEDPFFFLDIDNCAILDSSSGAHLGWSPIAQQLIAAFPYAAIEVSTSGRGLHIFGTGALPDHGCKNEALGLELYHTVRFVALTGNARGDASADCTYALPWLVDNFFPAGAATAGGIGGDLAAQWASAIAAGPTPDWYGPAEDGLLIERALRSRSARSAFDPNAACFADLWTADETVLARAYPDSSGTRSWDRSGADRALAQLLAFWTGRDCGRIERLMRKSALARDKWDREDYLPRTILGAVAANRDVLQDTRPPPAPALSAPEGEGAPVPDAYDALAEYRALAELPASVTNLRGEFMYGAEQQRHFEGCVYVTDAHKVMIPGGQLLKPDQFKVVYGGHQFAMDDGNTKVTRDAWECFSMSTVRRAVRVQGVCFRPDLLPGAVVSIEGRRRVNTYWPVEVRRMPGDVGPFLRHLEKLIPDATDRETVLSYLCACVQMKGTKFKWAPLIQGVEGNGKSLLSQCVAYAVGRRHCHWPRADQITEKFNSWLFDKVFIGVEDVYVPEHKRETLEILKPMITGENLAKRSMNADQIDSDVICNFILNCNARDGLRKSRNDRRLGIFYTAQQCEADLARDGLTAEYFSGLWDWLKADGFAIVAELLATRPISPEFRVTLMTRAPLTSSTEAAIAYGLGSVEQEVLEAVDQGLPGFAGGWISSAQFDALLDRIGKTGKLPITKRRELLQSLGYDWHPGLDGGRVHNVVMPDNAKPRLYIKAGHPSAVLVGGAAIAKAYTAAQAAHAPFVPPPPAVSNTGVTP